MSRFLYRCLLRTDAVAILRRSLLIRRRFFLIASLKLVLMMSVFLPVSSMAGQTGTMSYQKLEGDRGESEFFVEVSSLSLREVLKRIAKETQVPVHYSVLPEGLVTATCAGKSLRHVMECLLNGKADLIVRYRLDKPGRTRHDKVAELWVLGSRLDPLGKNVGACSDLSEEAIIARYENEKREKNQEATVRLLLAKANSENDSEKIDAIGALLATGRKGDPEIRSVLENNLHHDNPEVRAQAISTFALLEGNEAHSALKEALNDTSADVRMMAVDVIKDDITLLQHAANDSNQEVRNYAQEKLEPLLSK